MLDVWMAEGEDTYVVNARKRVFSHGKRKDRRAEEELGRERCMGRYGEKER